MEFDPAQLAQFGIGIVALAAFVYLFGKVLIFLQREGDKNREERERFNQTIQNHIAHEMQAQNETRQAMEKWTKVMEEILNVIRRNNRM